MEFYTGKATIDSGYRWWFMALPIGFSGYCHQLKTFKASAQRTSQDSPGESNQLISRPAFLM